MMTRTLFILLIVPSSLSFFSFIKDDGKHETPTQKVIKTIIVDAGHGIMDNGGHNGAKGSYSYEDEICLAVSKELINVLKTEMPEVKKNMTKIKISSISLSFHKE